MGEVNQSNSTNQFNSLLNQSNVFDWIEWRELIDVEWMDWWSELSLVGQPTSRLDSIQENKFSLFSSIRSNYFYKKW